MNEIEVSIEVLKFVKNDKTEDEILNEFGNREGRRLFSWLLNEDLADLKDGKIKITKKGEENLESLLKEHKKVKRKEFWRHPLVVGIIVAIISSFLTGFITYQITTSNMNEQRNLTLIQQATTESALAFEQTYQKAGMANEILQGQLDCYYNSTNETKKTIENNLDLLTEATTFLIKDDVNSSKLALERIDYKVHCEEKVMAEVIEEEHYKVKSEMFIVLIILILCIISIAILIKVLKKRDIKLKK